MVNPKELAVETITLIGAAAILYHAGSVYLLTRTLKWIERSV